MHLRDALPGPGEARSHHPAWTPRRASAQTGRAELELLPPSATPHGPGAFSQLAILHPGGDVFSSAGLLAGCVVNAKPTRTEQCAQAQKQKSLYRLHSFSEASGGPAMATSIQGANGVKVARQLTSTQRDQERGV